MWEREKQGWRRHLYQHPEADFHKSCAVVGGIDWGGGGGGIRADTLKQEAAC